MQEHDTTVVTTAAWLQPSMLIHAALLHCDARATSVCQLPLPSAHSCGEDDQDCPCCDGHTSQDTALCL